MKYTVSWLPQAQDELADLWVQATDRQAVTGAADRIDRALARDADTKGQPFDGARIIVQAPLAVSFTVSPDDCQVTVYQVWRVSP